MSNSEEHGTPIVHLANQLKWAKLTVTSCKLLQSYETGLTNEDLMELEQQNSAVENNEDSTADCVEVVEKNNRQVY